MTPGVQQFGGGLVFKDHRLCVSLNSTLESNKEEEDLVDPRKHIPDVAHGVVGVDLDRLRHPAGSAARQGRHELLQEHL